ncbi:MAG: glycosyltransferase [Nitrospirae bacterium]|nr:glycosyltransferase [Nitrospirota bacterium]
MNSSSGPDLSVIVPIYKEEASIQPFLLRLEPVLAQTKLSYEIIFCLDPSPDRTEEVVMKEIDRNSNIKMLIFSRRFGQPAATMAGLSLCKGKSCVVIDVDLQDPPELILEMLEKTKEGYEVVCAKRRSRQGETLLKKIIPFVGYKVISKFSEVDIPRNTGDFRIMTRRVIDELLKLNETHGFLRGLVSYVGFRQAYIEYDRDRRQSGITNYNRFTGSLKIGLHGIISFGYRPLQIMSILGVIFAGLSFLLGLWYVFQKLIGIHLTPGLPTTVLCITFFSGIQLLSLGLMGEYVGRIYEEVKQRPMYIIDRKINL